MPKWDEIGREREKKHLVSNSVHTLFRQENFNIMAKKLEKLKNLFPVLFLAKQDEVGQESEKKILLPNSVHTRPRQENSEKNSKKIEKIQKPLSNINFS